MLETVERLQSKRILVCGDLNLDQYTFGTVRRISPEAPVPVLQVERTQWRPGCAGNASLGLVSLGQNVRLLSRVGEERAGRQLLELLKAEGVDVGSVAVQEQWTTPIKNRLIAANQQMIRVDQEETSDLPEKLQEGLVSRLEQTLAGIDLIAISDYGKGFLTPLLLKELIKAARKAGIPVVVDPKGRDFARYAGVTLIKPNQTEAYEASGLGLSASLDAVAAQLRKITQAAYLMITRSEEGISLFDEGGLRTDLPTEVHEVRDVTGAGDTVLAVTAAFMANGLPVTCAAQASNSAASLAVERFGCARVTLADLCSRLSCVPA